ncbi:MAG: hypothetical protein ACREMO_12895, partial [Gemmatimonadales bacterium]
MILPLLLLALQAQDTTAAPGDTTATLPDALQYDITILMGDTGTHVLGQVQTTWRLRSDHAIHLELDSTLRVVRVLMDGKENTRLFRTVWAREGTWVLVPHRKRAGDSLITMIRYHGEPSEGLIIGPNRFGTRTLFTDNRPGRVRGWLPTSGQPGDKATASIHIEVPPGLQAIANGTLQRVDTLPRGRTMWHYLFREPLAASGVVLGTGRFAATRLPDAACEVRCMPLAVWSYPEDSAFAVDGPFRRAGEIAGYLSRLIGPYPFQRLTHIEAASAAAAGGGPTAILYDEQGYQDQSLNERLVAQATARQWFGDAVTPGDSGAFRLFQGLAGYFAALWAADQSGEGALAAEMRWRAEQVFASPTPGDTEGAREVWTLHSLRGLVGDSVFFAGIREYYRRYRDSTAGSADFAAVMSAAAGRDLDWYFGQAVTQPGYPMLELRWRYQKGKRLVLDLSQTQAGDWGIYRLPNLTLLIDGRRFPIEVKGRDTHVVLNGIRTRPASVQVDP